MQKTLPSRPPVPRDTDTGKMIETRVNSLMESMSFIFLIFIVTYFVLIIPSLVDMHDFFHEQGIIVHLSEYGWLLPGFLLSFGLFRFCTTIAIAAWRPNINPINYRQNETTFERERRLGGYMYSTVYYSLSWGSLLYMTHGSKFCPPEFGGALDITKSLVTWPYEVSKPIRIFYMLTLGHHLERLFHELLHNRKANSFYTMTFHHVVTIMLIFLSFYCRHLMFGIPVLLTHDFNDIFLASSRFLRESRFTNTASVLFLIMMASWGYTRLYVYYRHIVWGVFWAAFNLTEFTRRYLFMQVFFIPGLLGLFILNILWFFQINRVFVWRFVKKDGMLPMEDLGNKKQK